LIKLFEEIKNKKKLKNKILFYISKPFNTKLTAKVTYESYFETEFLPKKVEIKVKKKNFYLSRIFKFLDGLEILLN